MMLRPIRAAALAAAVCACLAATPAAAQATWGQALSPAQARAQQARYVALSRTSKLSIQTINAIAVNVGQRPGKVTSATLIAAVEGLVRDATESRARAADLTRQLAASQKSVETERALRLSQQAETAFDQGRFASAVQDTAAAQAIKLPNAADAERVWLAAVRSQASTLKLQGEYDSALRILRSAYAEARPKSVATRWALKFDEADVLSRKGSNRNDYDLMRDAVALYRGPVLALAPRSQRPLDWAESMIEMSGTLSTLGNSGFGAETLKEAVSGYKQALAVLPRDRYPEKWAAVQSALGASLSQLNDKTWETPVLEEAVTHFKLALEVLTIDKTPDLWAYAYSDLGNTYVNLTKSYDTKTAYPGQAVAAFETAALVFTPDRVAQYTAIENGIGNAYWAAASRGGTMADLQKAELHYGKALMANPRNSDEFAWRDCMLNIAGLYLSMGRMEQGTAHLQKALQIYQSLYPDERQEPYLAAMTVQNIARVKGAVFEKTGQTSFQTQALNEARAAMAIYQRAGDANGAKQAQGLINYLAGLKGASRR